MTKSDNWSCFSVEEVLRQIDNTAAEADPLVAVLVKHLREALVEINEAAVDAPTEEDPKLGEELAAQRGWDQAFAVIDGILLDAVQSTRSDEDAVERLQEILEEVDGAWSTVPDLRLDVLHAERTVAKPLKPSRLSTTNSTARAAPLKAGANQRRALDFLRANSGQAPHNKLREYLIAGGISNTGSYNTITRLVRGGAIIDSDGMLKLPT